MKTTKLATKSPASDPATAPLPPATASLVLVEPLPFNVEKFLRMAVELENMFHESFRGRNGASSKDDKSWVWVEGHETWGRWNGESETMEEYLHQIRWHAEMLYAEAHVAKMESELKFKHDAA